MSILRSRPVDDELAASALVVPVPADSDVGCDTIREAANVRKSASTNSIRPARPCSAALWRARARRVGDVSSAIT
jgi:hypothetical protein